MTTFRVILYNLLETNHYISINGDINYYRLSLQSCKRKWFCKTPDCCFFHVSAVTAMIASAKWVYRVTRSPTTSLYRATSANTYRIRYVKVKDDGNKSVQRTNNLYNFYFHTYNYLQWTTATSKNTLNVFKSFSLSST